jgi:hypothetical protein
MTDKIETTVPQAMIRLRGSSYCGPRELTAARLRLAQARPKDRRALGVASGRIAIHRVMRPGDQVTLDSLHFAVPRRLGERLDSTWLVFELEDTRLEPGENERNRVGYAYVHSAREIFSRCPQAPEDARAFQLADSSALVGRFALVMLTTNWPSPQETRAELRLWANPPSRHTRLSKYDHFKGARPIGGVAVYPDGKAYDGAADQRTTLDNPATELLDSTLYLGSPDPTDAVYTALRIQRISQSGFWGRFDGSDGLAVSIDSTIRSLGHARGVFCAIRLADTEDS